MAEVLPLKLTEVSFPQGHPQEGDTGPVFAFAVVHASGLLLFDTGVGSGDPEVDAWYRPARWPLENVLASHGLAIGDVTALANSHLHFDHCGQNELFIGMPIYVQAAEFQAVHEPDYTVPKWVDFPGAVYELLDGEAEILPGIRLMPTPGHTPGHQSLVVQEPEGPTIVAGQAVYTLAEWEGGTDPRRSGHPSAWDPNVYPVSVRRLRALEPRRVLFSHDEATWERPS
jgi:N-acyl homoserine lactone hydrolase